MRTRQNLAAAIIFLSTTAPISHSYTNYTQFCQDTSEKYASFVTEARRGRSGDDLAALQRTLETGQKYTGVVNRLSARTKSHVTRNLSEGEIRADLFGLCMSLTR